MPTLARIVPFTLAAPTARGGIPEVDSVGGLPGASGLVIYAELEVSIRGEPEPRGGYIISITEVDRAVRAELAQGLARHMPDGGGLDLTPLARMLHDLVASLGRRLDRTVSGLVLRLTPWSSLSVDPAMPTSLMLTRRFDFSASHRLHLPELSEEQNFARFGKCSRASGHGHNYRLDVTISRSIDPPLAFDARGAEPWESIVEQEVIERYDHRHLNHDCAEFNALNPSVENIARVIHERLASRLGGAGVRLERVCVWETEKTWCAVPS